MGKYVIYKGEKYKVTKDFGGCLELSNLNISDISGIQAQKAVKYCQQNTKKEILRDD